MAKIIGNTTATPIAIPDWSQIKNKPELGTMAEKSEITKLDLSTDVQTSLEKADSAIQSLDGYATETYVGEQIADVTLKNTVSGEAVKITDISPNEHELRVKLSSKNLLPYPYFDNNQYYEVGDVYKQHGITYTFNADRSITVVGTTTSESSWCPIGQPYLPEAKGIAFGSTTQHPYTDGVYVLSEYLRATVYGNGSTGKYYVRIVIPENTTVNTTLYPQVKKGTEPTAYAPYIEDFSEVAVSRHNANLLPFPYKNDIGTFDIGDVYESNGFRYIINEAGGISIRKIEGMTQENSEFYVYKGSEWKLPAGSYTIADMKVTDVTGTLIITDDITGITREITNLNNNVMITLDNMSTINSLKYMISKEYNGSVNFYPSVEVGSLSLGGTKATHILSIDPQIFKANADGTVEGITSLYPHTTLLTDTYGVIIETEYLTDEYDELFSSSVDKQITDCVDQKVDKIEGKGLSTNDYTNEEKEKLANIEARANNYTLPVASSSTLGGVKVGTGFSIVDSVLSVDSSSIIDLTPIAGTSEVIKNIVLSEDNVTVTGGDDWYEIHNNELVANTNPLLVDEATTFTINEQGTIKFSMTARSNGGYEITNSVKVKVDGITIEPTEISGDPSKLKFNFDGTVSENITLTDSCISFTFDTFEKKTRNSGFMSGEQAVKLDQMATQIANISTRLDEEFGDISNSLTSIIEMQESIILGETTYVASSLDDIIETQEDYINGGAL